MKEAKIINIIENYQAGKTEHFEEILEFCEPIIKSIIGRASIWGYEDDDIRQEMAIRLLRALRSYDKKKGKPSAYLYQALNTTVPDLIARNYKANRMANREAILESDLEFLLRSESEHDNVLDAVNKDYQYPEIIMKAEEDALLNKVKKLLSESEFQCFFLREYRELSYPEIMKQTNMNYKMVDNALSRAKTKLRKVIDNGGSSRLFVDEVALAEKLSENFRKKKDKWGYNKNRTSRNGTDAIQS